ncbi:hypothetical protein [Staphylococcus phage vB_StaM_PB50]|nr:hypothetical protein [Staphylococcus phage vB_StaM_PB50]
MTKILLKEDMFINSRNKNTLKDVDKIFNELIDSYDLDKEEFVNFNFTKKEKEIENLCNKLFNTKLKFSFLDLDDVMFYSSNFIGQTKWNEKQAKDIALGLLKIVSEEKNGIYYAKPTEIKVEMELNFIRYCILLRKSNNKIENLFDGSLLTSVLLHEIGHNLILPLELNVLNKGETPKFELKYKNNPPQIFSYSKDIEDDERRNKKYAIPMVSAMTIFFLSLSIVNAPIGIGTGLVSSVFLNRSVKNNKDKKDYNLVERTADYLPTLYGYSRELVKTTIIVREIDKIHGFKPPTYKNNKFNAIKNKILYPIKLFIRDYKDWETDIVESDIRILEKELSNNNNDNETKKEIKKTINDIKLLVKLSDNFNPDI